MSTQNIDLVRRLFDAFYGDDEPALRELLDGDFVTHAPGGGTGNADGWISLAKQFADALRDHSAVIEDIFSTDSRVAVRYTSTGVHTGELFGVAPTNMPLNQAGIEIYRVEGGRICEVWGQYDTGGLFSA
jgi:predicted ester cyclase